MLPARSQKSQPPPPQQQQQQNSRTHDPKGKPMGDSYYRAFQRCFVNERTGDVVLRFHKTDIVKVVVAKLPARMCDSLSTHPGLKLLQLCFDVDQMVHSFLIVVLELLLLCLSSPYIFLACTEAQLRLLLKKLFMLEQHILTVQHQH
jgi:hypothetical protein